VATSRTEQLVKIFLDQSSDMAYDKKKVAKLGFSLTSAESKQIRPLFHPNDSLCTLRKDIPTQSLTQKEALQNAPKKSRTSFSSMKVIAH